MMHQRTTTLPPFGECYGWESGVRVQNSRSSGPFAATSIAVFLFFLVHVLAAQETAPFPNPPDAVQNKVALADHNEPGLRIIIKGIVYKSDGKTPYAGLVLYLYQTDATGVYNKKNRSWREPRLQGWLKTDSAGGYAIRTIKPGAYPGGKIPAHIHLTMKYPDGHTRWLDDFLFEGDPNLSKKEIAAFSGKGNFSSIVQLNPQPRGPFYGRRDIVIPEQ